MTTPFHNWKSNLLRDRELAAPDGRPLYDYRLEESEFSSLEALLRDRLSQCQPMASLGVIGSHVAGFPALFVLYAAEWWWQRFDGSSWSWDPILRDLGADPNGWNQAQRSACVSLGLQDWRLLLRETGGYRYLSTIALQGGLPMRLLAEARGGLGRLLRSVLKEAAKSVVTTNDIQKKLGNSLENLSGMLENVQYLMETFLDKNRTQSMVRIFDQLDPFLGNMNTMSTEVTKLSKQLTYDQNLKKTLAQTVILTREVNNILPELNRQNPEVAKNLAELTSSLSQMTKDFKTVTGMLKDYGPEIPTVARRALEALDEATVLMKAMQKNFFLRSSVQEVHEEENKEIGEGSRMPAREKSKKP